MVDSNVVQVEHGQFIHADSVNRIDIELKQSQFSMDMYITLYNNSGSIIVRYPMVHANHVYEFYKQKIIANRPDCFPDLSKPFRETAEKIIEVVKELQGRFNLNGGAEFLESVDLTVIFTSVSNFLATQTLSYPKSKTLFMYLLDRFDNHADSKLWLADTVKGYIEALDPNGELNGEL